MHRRAMEFAVESWPGKEGRVDGPALRNTIRIKA